MTADLRCHTKRLGFVSLMSQKPLGLLCLNLGERTFMWHSTRYKTSVLLMLRTTGSVLQLPLASHGHTVQAILFDCATSCNMTTCGGLFVVPCKHVILETEGES